MKNEYSKDYFQLVQENERLVDKPLKTKQLSYLQDAMLRFGKNKYNVTATFILLGMMLLSIFVPVFTPTSYYADTNADLLLLPPRMPIFENFGIFDGTTQINNQAIDYTTIDPVTGLGYPQTSRIHKEYIFMDTLTNETVFDTTKAAQVIGGVNNLYVDFAYQSVSVRSPKIKYTAGQTFAIDVVSLYENSKMELYFTTFTDSKDVNSYDDLIFLGEFSSIGENVIDPLALINDQLEGHLIVRFVLDEVTTVGNEMASINFVKVINSDLTVEKEWTAYQLSMFQVYTADEVLDSGRYLRDGSYMIVASFKYDAYQSLKAPRQRIIGGVEYNKIISDNPGMIQNQKPHPSDPLNNSKWIFEGDYPIKEVTNVTVNIVGGEVFSTYTVQMDGLYAIGYDAPPYFIFGTDAFGKDLFVLLWLGLRTSLILGFLGSLVNIIVGVIWGATSAYYGGQVDLLMERFVDIWGSFPQITMIGILTVLLGPGFLTLFIFIIYDGWIGAAAVTRLQFYRYKGREYVLAARTLGASDGRIIFKHILPNALGTIVTRTVLSIPSVIFLEVNLSFLGFGIGNGQKLVLGGIELTGTSIGVILSDGQAQMLAGNYWLIIYPTLIVALLMLTFNMFGNALRDALNPQLRGNS